MKREEQVQIMNEVFAAISRHLAATDLPDEELPVSSAMFLPLVFLKKDARNAIFSIEPPTRTVFIDRVAKRSAQFLAGIDIDSRDEHDVADEAIGKLMAIIADELRMLKICETVSDRIEALFVKAH